MKKRQTIEAGIHLLYKNLGETPNETILRFKDDNPGYKDIPITYAGRLDPMAEGFILVLSGEKTLEKEKYLGLTKQYEFEMIWGFSTDSQDLLGLAEEGGAFVPSESEIKSYLKESNGKFEQVYPIYSSRPVNGKSLWEWAREGRISEVDIPKHEVQILESEYVSRRKISKKDLLEDIKEKISKVFGDFRQKEITDKWEEVLGESTTKEFFIDKISITVSSGFYIRQFVSDMGDNFETKAVTYHIKRTQIGEYC